MKALIKKLKCNRGFSLIELIVSFAILGFVAMGIFSFMVSGATTYRVVSTNVALQYDAQVAMAQLQEYIIDCNGGISYSSDTSGAKLYLVNREESGLAVHTFIFDSGSGELMYGVQDVAVEGDFDPDGATALLGENVSEFKLTMPVATGVIKSVDIAATFTADNKTCNQSKTLAMRNRVITDRVVADLIAELLAG